MTSLDHLLSPSKAIPPYLRRKFRQGLQPYSVELHLTAKCQYDCPHCSYGARRKSKKALPPEISGRLIDDLIAIKPKGVYFSGGGEPTLSRTWATDAARLIGAGVDVALITNGAALHHGHLGTLAQMGYIAISIYSADEAVHYQATGGGDFEVQWLWPSLIKRATVGARCVLTEENYRGIHGIMRRAIAAGYDYVIFIPEIDYEGTGRGLSEEARQWLMAEPMPYFRTNLEKLRHQGFQHYSKGYSAGGRCEAVDMRATAFVNYDGGVYLCQPHIGDERYCIGSLHEHRLPVMWNGERHLQVIDLLQDEWIEGRCRDCRCISYNKAIDSYAKTKKNFPIEITKDSFL